MASLVHQPGAQPRVFLAQTLEQGQIVYCLM